MSAAQEVTNSAQFGNGARIAPAARIDDGVLDMVVFEERSRLRTLWGLPRLFTGGVARVSGVSIRHVGEAVVESDRPMLYHVELQIEDASGKVILPKQVVEQSRVFTFDQTQAIGTGAEQDEIKKEMERDMVQAVMRKVEAAEHHLEH